MAPYIIRRLLLAIPTLLLMLTMIFVLARLVPGDPALTILGDQASEEALSRLRAQLGLDRPILVQYVDFIFRAVTGDFGRSLFTGRTVMQEVLVVLPYTLQLAAAAVLLAALLGIPLGTMAAIYRNLWPDYASRIFSMVGLSFPSFVSGILLLLVFAVHLRWFPVITQGGGGFEAQIRNLTLPTLTLGVIMTALIARVTRSSMLNVLGEDYIRTARAKGVRPGRLILRHALRNALIPVVTVIGLYFGTLIGNSVLVEIVFSRPGLGKLIVGALNSRDYTLLQGLMVVFAAFVILVNTVTDIAYGLVDPRVKYS